MHSVILIAPIKECSEIDEKHMCSVPRDGKLVWLTTFFEFLTDALDSLQGFTLFRLARIFGISIESPAYQRGAVLELLYGSMYGFFMGIGLTGRRQESALDAVNVRPEPVSLRGWLALG